MSLLSNSGALIKVALEKLTGSARLGASAVAGLGSAASADAADFAAADHGHAIEDVAGLAAALAAGGGGSGSAGASAYQIAVAAGFVGSEAEWLASLRGPQGATGPAGPAGATGANGESVTVTVVTTQAAFDAAPSSATNWVIYAQG